MWMEKHMLSAPTDMAGRSSSAINETPQNPTPNSLIHQCYSMLSGVHGEALSCDDVQLINPGIVAESNFLVASHGKDIFGTSSPINNSEFQEHTPTSLAARIGLEEKSSALSPSVSSLEALGVPCILETWPYTPNHFHGNGSAFQIGNLDSNVANLTDHAYTTSSNFSNELVLSLATSSASSRELPMSLNSSQAMLGSRFLIGIQDILAQLARFSLENLQQISFSAEAHQNANSMSCEAHVEAPLPAGSMKSQLLTLLELVDNRYSQCLDEVHLVVSAFHAATELDPHLHAHFSLQTISLLYKGLRERISNYILAMGADLSTQEKQTSTETSLFENQWALQQLKRKEHQSWRPQRGLPENSVSVLRAWMFQNFLHPYPKDAEKHLLAVKSGLTRSQVSNWFINARVRLWKPMIEEMYAEMNKRNACRNEEGTQSSPSSRISLSNHKFNMR